MLVSDGGIFARLGPRQPGGKWVSLNGDIKTMEYGNFDVILGPFLTC